MSSKKRGHFTWAAYNFEDKDPALYAAKTVVEDSGMTFKEIHAAGGATVATQTKWFLKSARSCRFDALMSTVRAAGGDITFSSPKGRQIKVAYPKAQNSRKK
jgi:hypothetical protein